MVRRNCRVRATEVTDLSTELQSAGLKQYLNTVFRRAVGTRRCENPAADESDLQWVQGSPRRNAKLSA